MLRVTQNGKKDNRGAVKLVLNFNYFRVLCKSVSVKTIYHTRKDTKSKTDNMKAVHNNRN